MSDLRRGHGGELAVIVTRDKVFFGPSDWRSRLSSAWIFRFEKLGCRLYKLANVTIEVTGLQVGALSADPKEEDQMLSMRTVMMTAVVVVAFCMGWLAKTSAQQKAPAPLITYFSHEKVDASFAQALASTGSRDLFARKEIGRAHV